MASLFNCYIHLFIQLCNFAVLKSSQSKFTTTAASAAVMCCFCLYIYCRLLYVLTELYINVSASLIEFLLHMNYISSVFEIEYNYTAIQYQPCLLYTNIDQTYNCCNTIPTLSIVYKHWPDLKLLQYTTIRISTATCYIVFGLMVYCLLFHGNILTSHLFIHYTVCWILK